MGAGRTWPALHPRIGSEPQRGSLFHRAADHQADRSDQEHDCYQDHMSLLFALHYTAMQCSSFPSYIKVTMSPLSALQDELGAAMAAPRFEVAEVLSNNA